MASTQAPVKPENDSKKIYVRRPDDRQRQKQTTKVVRLVGEIDRPFLILVLVLLGIGSVMIFSASYPSALSKYEDSFYIARRHLFFVALGMLVLAVTTRFADYRWLKRFSTLFFFVAIGMNILTAIPGIGLVRNGARRWLSLGFTDVQPSEILKFAVILICAKWITDHTGEMKKFSKGVLPFALFLLASIGPTILQKHLSCTIIICAIVFIMMWLGGTSLVFCGSCVVVGAAGIFVVLQTMAHSLARIAVWRDPFIDPRGDGYQPIQSLYAICAGGFFGLGLGQSNQKHAYLPEAHNDYIFSILCEELGFFGATAVLFLFAALVWRGFVIAKRAPNRYASLLVMGIVCSLAIHVLLNIAVVTNTLPSTGIGLPFFSYGGTSLWIWLAQMGVVLSVSRYSYLDRG